MAWALSRTESFYHLQNGDMSHIAQWADWRKKIDTEKIQLLSYWSVCVFPIECLCIIQAMPRFWKTIWLLANEIFWWNIYSWADIFTLDKTFTYWNKVFSHAWINLEVMWGYLVICQNNFSTVMNIWRHILSWLVRKIFFQILLLVSAKYFLLKNCLSIGNDGL